MLTVLDYSVSTCAIASLALFGMIVVSPFAAPVFLYDSVLTSFTFYSFFVFYLSYLIIPSVIHENQSISHLVGHLNVAFLNLRYMLSTGCN